MFGMIMPEPLRMPATDTSTPSISQLPPEAFGNVSVVMKARVHASQSGGASRPDRSGSIWPT